MDLRVAVKIAAVAAVWNICVGEQQPMRTVKTDEVVRIVGYQSQSHRAKVYERSPALRLVGKGPDAAGFLVACDYRRNVRRVGRRAAAAGWTSKTAAGADVAVPNLEIRPRL